ncbi:MAG: biotin--[acetyl-CoA-carboxylase] ligase [Actinomycetota bacterium]
MLRQDSLADAVRAGGITVPPVFHEVTGSTNADAVRLAAAGAAEWKIVAAGHQMQGRGRMGRGWTSSPGKALLFSILLRPPLPPDETPLIALLAAVAMADVCKHEAGVEVFSKWPNDLLASERKLGGILPEARITGGQVEQVVLGIGVNISMQADDFPGEFRRQATSLSLEGSAVSPGALLTAFLRRFREAYRPHEQSFGERVLEAYRMVCTTIGRRVKATGPNGRVVEGTAIGINHHGGLIVEDVGRRTAVAFGEVAHLDQ